MSTPEHPATPALTRKQIRELRNTGSTPIIDPNATPGDPDDSAAPPVESPAAGEPTANPPATAAAAPFPRPSEPAPVPPAPVPDAAVDLGVSPLTRRQARQQERIRTASVPVITPEIVAAHAAATTGTAPAVSFPSAPPALAPDEPERPLFTTPQGEESAVSTDSGMHALFGIPREAAGSAPEQPADEPAPPVTATTAAWWPAAEPEAAAEAPTREDADEASSPETEGETAEAIAAPKSVSPLLGASLLDERPAATRPAAVEFPPSFDQLLTRTTGALAIPNTLIVSQAPEVSPLVAPVTATGEVIVTGTFNLPEGLGSTGHAKGTADGKEIDATLVDGELPSHSSPTPIAASAAVSTAKTPGEVIKPPTPEKGSKLMMSLAITAGVLALALVGVLILAFVTGVF
ncbi:hypothetical protein [Microbacterium sp. E-13]|uniref:hypothetical protein n=1 Tax=Microbacterium sp. E-13 TaxID=3404048 RepID=UPI003CEBDC17